MRSRLLTGAAIAAAALALPACQKGGGAAGNAASAAAPGAAGAAADAVKQAEQAILAGWKAKDAAKVAAGYADDAVVAVPGMPAAKGRDAVARDIAADLKDPAFSIDFANEATEVAGSGELAYTRGTFRVGYTDPATKRATTQTGNYLTVFRKSGDGSWKAVADYATGDSGTPPAGG
jgi:uncharacterized protein (TIGR02246 family)